MPEDSTVLELAYSLYSAVIWAVTQRSCPLMEFGDALHDDPNSGCET